MNKKPCGLFFLLFLCVPFYTFASSVSVFMCQNDSAVETLRETTFILESGILGILFDRGYIVSSEAGVQNPNDVNEAFKQALKNGKEGFFEYLVHVTVNYTTTVPENPAGGIFDDIKSIEWRIVRLKNAGVVADKKNIVPVKYEAETDVRALKRFAGELGSDIETAIRRYDERGVTR